MGKRRYDLPPLDLIEGFEAAARNLSFTKAAAELFRTQSAISRQIQSLEEGLGVRLFERRTRELLLTEEGQTLYRTVADVLSQLHETKRTLTTARTRALTVTTSIGFASLWLIPRFASFSKAHPKIDVRISANNEIQNLDRSGLDLAIRYCAPRDAPAGAPRLFSEEIFPVCSPTLIAQPGRPLAAPEDLKQHVLLHLYDPGGPNAGLDWSVWLEAVRLPLLKPAGALHFSHYDQLIAAAIQGQGVALGRSPLVRRLLHNGQLVTPFKRRDVSSRAYFIVESKQAAGNPDVAEFKRWLLQEAKAERGRRG